jgi:predicted permease
VPIGRAFTAAEDRDVEGAYPYAVISDRLWRSYFRGDPAVVGRPVRMNGQLLTIIGVAAPEFAGSTTGLALDVWVHLSMMHLLGSSGSWQSEDRNARPFALVGRLRPGATVGQARAQAEVIARRLAVEYPETHAGESATVVPLWKSHVGVQGLLRSPLLILMTIAVMVLLIACSNVANLLLARSVSRQSEFGIRLALGASRFRLIRMVLTEGAVLAVAGAMAGLVLTQWMGEALRLLMPRTDLPLTGFVATQLNFRALVCAAALCVITAVLSAAVPALYAGRGDIGVALKDAGRSTVGARPHWARGLLITAQVAFASIGLVGALLFGRSFENAAAMHLGFDPENVHVARLFLASTGYSAEQEMRFCQQLRQRLEHVRGIAEASYAIEVPSTGRGADSVEIEGHLPRAGESMAIHRNNIGPGYFRLLRIPLLAGREFTERDDAHAPGVVIVNESFARRFYADANPLGRRARSGTGEPWFTIVGLVRDVRHGGPDDVPQPMYYAPFQQAFASGHDNFFLVRTTRNNADGLQALRRAIAALDPTRGLYMLQPLRDYIDTALYARFVAASLMVALAILSVVLAAVGLYSVMAYAVSERTQEIAIRMALGARPTHVLAVVLRQAMVMVAVGLLVGLVSALAAARLVSSMLVGVVAGDPVVFGFASLFLSAVALFATYWPARRATRVDPMIALRRQ